MIFKKGRWKMHKHVSHEFLLPDSEFQRLLDRADEAGRLERERRSRLRDRREEFERKHNYAGVYYLRRSDEFSRLPTLFEEINFRPRRATFRVRKISVLGGLFEVQTNSLILEE
jgi:hypothetical protein